MKNNAARNALNNAVNRAIANGAPIFVNQPPTVSFYEQQAVIWQERAASAAKTARERYDSPIYRDQTAFWQREAAHASLVARQYLGHAIEHRAYLLSRDA